MQYFDDEVNIIKEINRVKRFGMSAPLSYYVSTILSLLLIFQPPFATKEEIIIRIQIISILIIVSFVTGDILLAIAVRKLSKILEEPQIFKYFLVSVIMLSTAVPVQALMGIFFFLASLQQGFSTTAQIFLLLLIAATVVSVIGSYYGHKWMRAVHELTGIPGFKMACDLLQVGALTVPIIIGLIYLLRVARLISLSFAELEHLEEILEKMENLSL